MTVMTQFTTSIDGSCDAAPPIFLVEMKYRQWPRPYPFLASLKFLLTFHCIHHHHCELDRPSPHRLLVAHNIKSICMESVIHHHSPHQCNAVVIALLTVVLEEKRNIDADLHVSTYGRS